MILTHVRGGFLLLFLAATALAQVQPITYRVPDGRGDAADLLSPSEVQLGGWLGERVSINAAKRLKDVDLAPFLAGYHHKPGSHPWIGEHIGKWIHAATLAWANTGDPVLKRKLDAAVAELISTQEPDGYLGTYLPEYRFNRAPGPGLDAGWDVWSHKYNLIGLETYYQYTGDPAALASCRKMADLLTRVFPHDRSIVDSGWHVGMASTSVLEPIVILYRMTGEKRYLDFAHYIVGSWEEPRGPKILTSLLAGKGVDQIGNAKAYEMTSNLVGLCELARATGDAQLMHAAELAWTDIVQHQLYLTGTASQWERFQSDYALRNDVGAHVGETCVTVTWIEMNLELLRMTGEAQYAQELQRSFYNHLAAAQNPSGEDWCYYTPLEGTKPYDDGITCCHSSGPRGMALVPQASYLKTQLGGKDAVLVDTFETSTARLMLGGQEVTLEQKGGFPYRGESVLTVHLAHPAIFALKVLVPDWAAPVQVATGIVRGGWSVISPRPWKDGDTVSIHYYLGSRLIVGDRGNRGDAALTWGPFVLACENAAAPHGLPALSALGFAARPVAAPQGDQLVFSVPIVGKSGASPQAARFMPFADAGGEGSAYRIWLRAPGVAAGSSDPLLEGGKWTQSRQGTLQTAAEAEEQVAMHTTFDRTRAVQDWFAVALPQPVTIGRVVFVHGTVFPNGGWFDTSRGKPVVQVQRTAGGPWEPVGTLDNYPATTASHGSRLQNGQAFMARLAQPVTAYAVRVIGAPAGGSDGTENYVTCAGIEAFRN